MRLAHFKVFFLFTFLLYIASCKVLPTGQTAQLANSITLLHTNLDESFGKTVSLLYERAYLRHGDTVIKPSDYRDSTVETIKNEFDKRLKYLEVLVAYFKALNALATKNNDLAIRESTTSLDASLVGLQKAVSPKEKNSYDDIAAGFSVITDFISRYISQGIQRKSLKLAMDKAQPSLDSICGMLQRELEDADLLVLTNKQSVINRLIAIRNTETGPAAREKWDRYIRYRLDETDALHGSYLGSIKLVAALPKAHSQARAALEKQTSFKDAIISVAAEASNLQDYFIKLKTPQPN